MMRSILLIATVVTGSINDLGERLDVDLSSVVGRMSLRDGRFVPHGAVGGVRFSVSAGEDIATAALTWCSSESAHFEMYTLRMRERCATEMTAMAQHVHDLSRDPARCAANRCLLPFTGRALPPFDLTFRMTANGRCMCNSPSEAIRRYCIENRLSGADCFFLHRKVLPTIIDGLKEGASAPITGSGEPAFLGRIDMCGLCPWHQFEPKESVAETCTDEQAALQREYYVHALWLDEFLGTDDAVNVILHIISRLGALKATRDAADSGSHPAFEGRAARKPLHFIDCGAAQGDFTKRVMELWCGRKAKVHLFEASHGWYQRLERLEPCSGLELALVKGAVGDVSGNMTLWSFVDSNIDGPQTTNSLNRDAIAVADTGSSFTELKEVPVTVWALDDFARQESLEQVLLLKIDVEGFDLKVLFGARALLGRQAVDVILFEYNYHWLVVSHDSDPSHYSLWHAVKLLQDCGYESYLLGKFDAVRLDGTCWSPIFETYTWSNVVAFSSAYPLQLGSSGLPHPVKLFNTREGLHF
jgi:FkbM family methyltransferase